MSRYKPSVPFSVAMRLLIPSVSKVRGVEDKSFPDPAEAPLIYGSFRSFGGTEQSVNGLTAVLDTANVETWFRPDIASGCRVKIEGTDKIYEIIAEPENVELRNQFLLFKVERVKGGA